MSIFEGFKKFFTLFLPPNFNLFLPQNKCMACDDEVRPAGAVMGRPNDPEFIRIMSIKPGYTCSKCGRIICSECIKKGIIWQCPFCGGEIKQVAISFGGPGLKYR